MLHGHRPTQPPTPIPSRPPTLVHFTKAHYITDLHQVLSQKKGPTIGTENQQRLHQAWPSFSKSLNSTMCFSNREATRKVRQRRAAPHLRLCNPSHTGLSACLLLSHGLSSPKYLYTLLLYVV